MSLCLETTARSFQFCGSIFSKIQREYYKFARDVRRKPLLKKKTIGNLQLTFKTQVWENKTLSYLFECSALCFKKPNPSKSTDSNWKIICFNSRSTTEHMVVIESARSSSLHQNFSQVEHENVCLTAEAEQSWVMQQNDDPEHSWKRNKCSNGLKSRPQPK